MRFHWFFRILMVGQAILSATEAAGQQRPGGQVAPRQEVKMIRPFDLTGTIVAVRRGTILVKSPADEEWMLGIPNDVEVRVTGEAGPDVLRRSMYVRFLAQVDKRRSRVLEPVTQMTIFVPSKEPGRMPGVFYPGQGQEGFGMEGSAAAPGVPNNPPEQQPDAADSNVETFDIRAQIVSVRGRLMTVNAPNQMFKPSLKIQLDEQIAIDLDITDYSLAKPGDRITTNCYSPNEKVPRFVTARSVKIELAQPLGKPTARRPKPDGSNRKRPGQGAQEQSGPGRQPVVNIPGHDSKHPVVQMLIATPEELRGKQKLNLTLDGRQHTFVPCKPVAQKDLREKAGLPDKARTVQGELPVGDADERVAVKWQLWNYGKINVLIDERKVTRYYAIEEDKPADEEQEENE